MRTALVASLTALAALAGSAACTRSSDPSAAPARLPEVSVDELATMLARDTCQPVDANVEATRKRMGIIPGAVLLSDHETFQPSELPADKARLLVFYCANRQCGASHAAAEKAIAAGHTRVKILPDGIAGWVKAGMLIQKI